MQYPTFRVTSQSHGNRIILKFPSRALSAEVAAPFVRKERDAIAPCVIDARAFARREVGDFAW